MQAEIRTDFLVLRKIPYGDTSLIVAGLSESRGQLHFLVRGARKVSRRQTPLVDLFRVLQVIYREGKSDLHTWRQAELVEDYGAVARNYECCETAASLARFTLANSAEGAESRRLFTAVRVALGRLAAAAVNAPRSGEWQQSLSVAARCGVELAYLSESGLLPAYAEHSQPDRQVRILLDMALNPAAQVPELSLATWRELHEWSCGLLNETH